MRWISRASVVFALAVSIALAGCGDSSPPSTYMPSVASVPSLTSSRRAKPSTTSRHEYGVSVGRLMTANGISDPRELRVGQILTIPGAYRSAAIGTASSGVHRYTGERASRQFLWPVQQGVVSSGFGIRNGAMHSGVDIAAPAGTPVLCRRQRRRDFLGHAPRLRQHRDNSSRRRLRDGLRTQRAQPCQSKACASLADRKSARSDALDVPPARIFTSKCAATTSPKIRSPICPSPRPTPGSALPQPAAASIFDHRTRDCLRQSVRWNQG